MATHTDRLGFRFPGVQTATVSSGLLSSGQLSTGVHPFHWRSAM